MTGSTALVGLEDGPRDPAEIRQLAAGEEDEWDRFVLSAPSGTLFHLDGWRRVAEKAMGWRCFPLVYRNERGISGVFPISWIRNRLFGDCLVSMPLGVYGGICSTDPGSYSSLLDAGTDLARRLNVKYLEMRNQTDLFPTSLATRDLYVTFTQDLSSGPDKLLQGLPRDTRYMVRKSLKAGLEWVDDLTLDEFYEIYARSVHRLGTPVFSKNLFSAILGEFPRHSKIFGVRKGKKAIAGVLCFYFRDRVMPYYGGALSEYNKDAPNNFMYWSLIAQSCREGYRVFDFGRSKRGTGSFQFKSSWSMQMSVLPYRYQLIRANQVPQMSPVDQKFRLPVEIWKRLPYSWTKILGPRVIRWVPSV